MVEAAEEMVFLLVRVRTAVLRGIEMKIVEDTPSRLKNGAKSGKELGITERDAVITDSHKQG